VSQCDLEEDALHDNHDEGLDEEGVVVTCDDPVEYSVELTISLEAILAHGDKLYFRIEASSIMRGISREKPADVRVRWME
jgi:hypothetical protein